MKSTDEFKTLKLEEFKIVEFQNSLNGIRGGTGWLCRNKPPTSDPTNTDQGDPEPTDVTTDY